MLFMDEHNARRRPGLSIFFAYGATIPIGCAGAIAWAIDGRWLGVLAAVTLVWSSVLLIFFAGVRRGLSFFTAGGPRPAQIGTMLWLFTLGLAALLLPYVRLSLALLVLGYTSIAWLDPPAAQRGEAPAFFARLRPPQMALAALGLTALLVRLLG